MTADRIRIQDGEDSFGQRFDICPYHTLDHHVVCRDQLLHKRKVKNNGNGFEMHKADHGYDQLSVKGTLL